MYVCVCIDVFQKPEYQYGSYKLWRKSDKWNVSMWRDGVKTRVSFNPSIVSQICRRASLSASNYYSILVVRVDYNINILQYWLRT